MTSPLRLPEPGAGVADGAATSRRAGAGTDFFGIREWRSGDAATAIHWRASARRSRLVVVERERPGRPSLLVAVDTAVDEEQWEHALARAAATAVLALRSGQAVALLAGSTTAAPTRPRDLLDWFAALGPVAPLEPATLRAAMGTASAGGTVLWVGDTGVPPQVAGHARAAGLTAIAAAPRSEWPGR
jgi:uncharacterized protein (DUF58 family)